MSQIVKKYYSWINPQVDNGVPQKESILNCLCRHVSFVSYHNEIMTVSEKEMRDVASHVYLPYKLVRLVITHFLVNLVYFRRFLCNYKLTNVYTRNLRKMVIYLRKLHRLAPIFDLPRAKENAKILKSYLEQQCFFPQFTTQLAIVLFATDIYDNSMPKKIIQSNLRILCDCSAYAFHRTRNRLGLGSGKRY